MNDRLKFRVWDNECLEYIPIGSTPDYILDIDLNTGQIIYESKPDGEDEWPKDLDTSSLVVEQCTGLKDKNGNLIYENDRARAEILDERFIGDAGYSEYTKSITGIVKWNKFGAEFVIEQENGEYVIFSEISDPENIEIIGNIHQQEDKE